MRFSTICQKQAHGHILEHDQKKACTRYKSTRSKRCKISKQPKVSSDGRRGQKPLTLISKKQWFGNLPEQKAEFVRQNCHKVAMAKHSQTFKDSGQKTDQRSLHDIFTTVLASGFFVDHKIAAESHKTCLCD